MCKDSLLFLQHSFIYSFIHKQRNMGLIGAGIGAAGSIFGGIKASQAMKQVAQTIDKQQRENEDWYNRRYNEDATQRADAQRVLSRTEEILRQRNKAAAGRAAVMGTTDEGVAAEQAANAQVLADATSQLAANSEAKRDAIEQQYQARKNELDAQKMQLRQQQAQAISQAVQGVTGAAGQMDFGGSRKH